MFGISDIAETVAMRKDGFHRPYCCQIYEIYI